MQLPQAKVVLVDCREELKKYNIDINDYVKKRMKGDTPGGEFPCRECSLVFRTKRFRMIHETRYHSASSTLMHHLCSKCPKRFYTAEDLNDHFYIRHSNQKYQCELCSFKCKFRGRMQHHLDTKHRSNSKKSFPCEFCDRRFFLPQLLKSHIVRHHKSESKALTPYTCRLCDHKMVRRDSIIGHMQRHNEITDHKCKSCDLRFITMKELVVHTKLHSSDTEQISCCFCDFQSPDSVKMDQHIQEVHIDPKKMFACSECGKEFQSKANLRYHENVTHRQEQNHEDMEFGDIFKGTTLDDSDEEEKQGTSNSHMSDESLEELQKQITSINVNEEQDLNDGEPKWPPMNGDSEMEEDTPVVISIAEAEKLLSIPEKIPPIDISHDKSPSPVNKEEEEDEEDGESEVTKKTSPSVSGRSIKDRTCSYCGVLMNKRRDLLSHEARHSEATDHKCEFCPLRFLARTRLLEHSRLHRKKPPTSIAKMYKCSMCPYTTKSRFYMRSHNKNNHKEKPPTPPPVVETYQNGHGSAEKAPADKTFKCEICGKVLKTVTTLKAHWNIHKSLFKCLICNKGFAIKDRLDRHIEKHDESKDLQCNFCPLRFLTGAEMELHQGLDHEQANVKVVTCPYCPYRTSVMRITNMRSHLRNVHKLPNAFKIIRELRLGAMDPEEKKLLCKVCHMKMPTEEALQAHHERKHMPKVPTRRKSMADVAKETTVATSKSETTTEVATSTQPTSILECFFECDLCEIFLESISAMHEHFVQQHDNLKPYKCEICDNRFPTWPILRRHQRLSHKAMPTFIPDRIIIQQRKRRRSSSTSSSSSSTSGSSSSSGSSSNSSSSTGSSASFRAPPRALKRPPMVRGKSLPPTLPKKTVSLKVMTLTNRISDSEYQCDICRQFFDNEEAFKSHFQYHNNVKPYKCELCAKRFDSWVSLRRHQGNMHKGYRNNCA